VAYTNVYQTFDVSVCCEAANGTSARLSTDINVTDNLLGGRLGVRGNHGFGGSLRVFGAVMADLYQRLSNLNSTQTTTNICYDGGPCGQSFRLNQYASQNQFVPRAEVALGAAVDIVENWSLGLFFKFDGALEHEPAGRPEVQWLRASRGRHAGQQEPAWPVGGRSDPSL
jgi:hypothetical protein